MSYAGLRAEPVITAPARVARPVVRTGSVGIDLALPVVFVAVLLLRMLVGAL